MVGAGNYAVYCAIFLVSYLLGLCSTQFDLFQTRRVPPPADYGQADCIDMRRSPKLLQYYTKYSETGCKIECETSYIMKQCGGCRPYLSPREFIVG